MNNSPVLILFANLKGNVGDFAILHAMLVEVEKRYPGSARHVYSHGHKEVDEMRMMAFLTQPHPAFIYQGATKYIRTPKGLGIIKRLGYGKWLAGKLIDRLSARFRKLEPFRTAGNYQAVFLAGGEQWGGFSTGINMFAILDAVSCFNPNIFIFQFSVKRNLLDTYSIQRLTSSFSKIAGNLVVRDSTSGDTMRHISARVIDGADCVFSLAGQVDRSPAPGLGNETIVTLAVTEAEASRPAEFAATIRGLTGAGVTVRLLSTCEQEDGPTMSELSRTLGVEFICPATWQDVVAEFKRSSVVVTNRLHCMIFTFFADVPVVPLVDREKVLGVCRDAGLRHSIRNIGELTPERVGKIIADSGSIRSTMSNYLEKVRGIDADIQGR
jgi:hypothetical protein